MTGADVVREARRLLEQGHVRGVLDVGVPAMEALDQAAGWGTDYDQRARIDAQRMLDAVTPRPWTFSLWADGAKFASLTDVEAGFVYSYDRPLVDVLALMGRALVLEGRS